HKRGIDETWRKEAWGASSRGFQVTPIEALRAKMLQEDATIRDHEETFGSEITAQLRNLAHEIAEAKGAIILYDEMATLEPGCDNVAEDLHALAVVTGNIDRPRAGVGQLLEADNSLVPGHVDVRPDELPGCKPAP